MPTLPTHAEFRAEALEFLEANAKRRPSDGAAWGEGDDRIGMLSEHTAEEEAEAIRAACAWRSAVFDGGFGWISGPGEFGGRGLSHVHEWVWASTEADFDVPSQAPLGVGLHMVAPTILAHGTDATRSAYLRAIRRGDIVACQLFSEPEAGSDLAGVGCRAVRDGDGWVVNGQKVWTSRAHFSDIGEILCRTDLTAPKHKGLTAFVVNMTAPGVEVRPLRQMTGGSHFNEVFFTDVRIPDDHRLGDVNDGWRVALTTLMNERAGIGGGGGVGAIRIGRLFDVARQMGRGDDHVVRQRLADIYIRDSIATFTHGRAVATMLAGLEPGPEMSIGKLMLTEKLRLISDAAAMLLGPRLAAETGEWGTYAWSEVLLWTPGLRLAGGSDEIMRNILAERALGLPKEPRP